MSPRYLWACPYSLPTSCTAKLPAHIVTHCICFQTFFPLFLSLLLPYVVRAKQQHQPLSQCSRGPESGMPLMWICLREEVNNIFENSHQQQDLAQPSVVISVVEGRGWVGVKRAPARGRKAAFPYLCAKCWYLITSLPRWWDQFACCSISHHRHLTRRLPCRKGQGHWHWNTTSGTSHSCTHVYGPSTLIYLQLYNHESYQALIPLLDHGLYILPLPLCHYAFLSLSP